MRRQVFIAMLSALPAFSAWASEGSLRVEAPASEDAALSNIIFGNTPELGIIEENFSLSEEDSEAMRRAEDLSLKRWQWQIIAPQTVLEQAEASGREGRSTIDPDDPITLSAKLKSERGSAAIGVSPLTLQPFRKESTLKFALPKGGQGQAVLTNINPNINMWYTLAIEGLGERQTYHFENIYPDNQTIELSPDFSRGIVIQGRDGQRSLCDLWSADSEYRIKIAKYGHRPFMPLCQNRIYLRNRVEGAQTTKEWVVEFLRDKVWGGEEITTFVKETFFRDHFLINGSGDKGDKAKAAVSAPSRATPQDALLNSDSNNILREPKELGIALTDLSGGMMMPGKWHTAQSGHGIYVSMIEANMIRKDIMESYSKRTTPLDSVEMGAVAYLVAFDLSTYEMGFSLGTDHPRVNWSERVLDSVYDPKLAGPDGIAVTDPLIRVGIVSPVEAKRVGATFTGGFKRDHGAMKWGALALVNGGSHYGFIEKGAVLSRLLPGLATIVGYRDMTIDMRTWSAQDDARLRDVVFARQNGVPILDADEKTGETVPGALLSSWGMGNWSGSQDRKFRTLRAGVCLAQNGERRFLIYGYFSTITPSGMARIFQAYQCTYAMHLDMNAMEHTYLALYPEQKKGKTGNVQHLITGMSVLDRSYESQEVPRFIGLPDNRDFFYMLRRGNKGE